MIEKIVEKTHLPLAATIVPPKARSQQLDIIKALAIMFVVAFHYFPGQLGWHMHVLPAGFFENYWAGVLAGPSSQILGKIGIFLDSYLYVGVNLFVIASGFGLYLSHLKSTQGKPGTKIDLKEFFVKRVWRLMPAAILATILVFFIKGFFLGGWPVQNFYLNFFPFLGGLNLFSNNWFFPPINGDTWFLGLIVQLYLFFPLLVKLYEKLGEKKFLILLLLVSVIFRTAYYIFWKGSVESLSYGLSIGRLFEFGFGMVVAKNFLDGKKLSASWILAIPFGLGYFWPISFPFADGLFGVGVFTALWLVAEKLPLWSGWVKIAALSYFVFLLHHPLIWIVGNWGFHNEWSLIGVIVIALIFLASCLFAQIAQWVLDFVSAILKKLRGADVKS